MQHPRDLSHLSSDEVLQKLQTRLEGLTDQDIKKRSNQSNILPPKKKPGLIQRFANQFKSPLIFILLFVAILVPFIGEWSDAIIILCVLTFNATVGVIQEGRADAALAALEHAFISTSLIRRNGQVQKIPSTEIVEGDIIILSEGTQIPADGRLISGEGLGLDESALTGESVPVSKTPHALTLDPHAPLGDIKNAVFRQTLVIRGNGEMVVTATGKDTEIGHIASLLKDGNTEPPLAKKVRRLSRFIAIIIGLFSVSLFLFGVAMQRPAAVMFATVVSLVVSLIPEGLPIVLTIVLARGVSRMAEKHAVVKRLNAVEGLGQVDIICTDKTGTLTLNQLNIAKAIVGKNIFTVRGIGFEPEGQVKLNKKNVNVDTDENLNKIATACALLGQQAVHQTEQGEWKASRDPVDAAFQTFAIRAGRTADGWTKLEEKPFSYTDKRRSTTFSHKDGRKYSVMAGSPESVLSVCKIKPDAEIEATWTDLAKQGLRIIAFAERPGKISLEDNRGWICTGFVAMGDDIRKEVPNSIAWCQNQGIRVIMVTGDHPETALYIAKKAGIATERENLMSGSELDEISDIDLPRRIKNIRVFARISPEHKLRIVRAYRSQKFITAMTGDGVNDAPALQEADIGVAMGKNGTDVAREASDLILLDDRFETIVNAIQEGRAVVGNVRKVLVYLFSTSIGVAFVLTVTVLTNLPLPLLPGQILWLNLVTDGFLDMALAMEPTHKSTREQHNGDLIGRANLIRMTLLGSVMAIITLGMYINILDRPTAEIQTSVLLLLAIFQWVNAWSARSESRSIFSLSPFSNPHLIAATLIIVILQLFAIYAPPFQKILRTTALNLEDWIIFFGLALTIIVADEIWKRWHRHHLTRSAKIAIS